MSWLAFTTDEVGQAAEVRLEAPDALVGGEHRVVVRRRVLVVDVVAVHDDLVARLPVAHRRARPAARRPTRPEPTTWYGSAWRAPHTDSLPRRSRNPNVGSGSKIEVHTVLKLIALAMTATYASSGASSGVATSSTWSDLRGSLSAESRPSNIVCSSRSTNAARYDSGMPRAAISSPEAPARMASRICCMGGNYPSGHRAPKSAGTSVERDGTGGLQGAARGTGCRHRRSRPRGSDRAPARGRRSVPLSSRPMPSAAWPPR